MASPVRQGGTETSAVELVATSIKTGAPNEVLELWYCEWLSSALLAPFLPDQAGFSSASHGEGEFPAQSKFHERQLPHANAPLSHSH
jgi:hypothetical protein